MFTAPVLADLENLLALFGHNRPLPIFLLGAGASVKSGVPLTGELVEWAAKWKFCRNSGLQIDDPTVKRTDWLKWLHAHQWYRKELRIEDNYCDVVEHLLVPKTERKEFFLWSLNREVPPSAGYEDLLRLMDEGFVSTILTTNFDRVLPDLKAARKRPHHLEVIRTPDEMVAFSTSPIYPQLVYLHGAVEYYTDLNLKDETKELRPSLVQLLSPLLRDHPLVVIGYRGAEPSIVRSLLLDQAKFANHYPHGIYWCTLDGKIHPLVGELARGISTNFQLVLIPGFDELMRSIATRCEALPRKRTFVSATRSGRDALPFDMTPLPQGHMDELDWVKIREEVSTYCREMRIEVPAEVSREFLEKQMLALDLAVEQNGTRVPTIAGQLLFAREPHHRIPSAIVKVIESGKVSRIISGNLWAQKEALDLLCDEVNRPFLLKTSHAEVTFPYPKIALRELCLNALVHRSYETQEPLTIELEANFFRITNPGGLVREVAGRVHTTLQAQIEAGATGIKGYRNSVIADVFCGAGRMEKKGSGLPDVHRSVLKNGGQTFFGPTEDNSQFKAVIYRRADAENVDANTGTATPVSNISRYSTNLLEIMSLPSRVWHHTCNQISELVCDRRLWFSTSGGGKLSFARCDQRICLANSITTEALLETQEGRREFTGLVNTCLESFLKNRDLRVDPARKRAYFGRTKEGAREVRYQATIRQASRTVTKPYISKVSQRVLYWVHEAIWFGVERLGRQHVIRLLPGYVFTYDGHEKLLDHRRIGALATRKAARDFSLQVFNHLVFWSFVLSGGNSSFEIETGDEPIVVNGAFASCDLQMPPNADVAFQPDRFQNKLDARLEDLENEIAEDAEVTSSEKNVD